MILKSDAKFKENLTGGFKYDRTNLANFHVSSGTSENFHIDGLLLSKLYRVSAKKLHRSYVS